MKEFTFEIGDEYYIVSHWTDLYKLTITAAPSAYDKEDTKADLVGRASWQGMAENGSHIGAPTLGMIQPGYVGAPGWQRDNATPQTQRIFHTFEEALEHKRLGKMAALIGVV